MPPNGFEDTLDDLSNFSTSVGPLGALLGANISTLRGNPVAARNLISTANALSFMGSRQDQAEARRQRLALQKQQFEAARQVRQQEIASRLNTQRAAGLPTKGLFDPEFVQQLQGAPGLAQTFPGATPIQGRQGQFVPDTAAARSLMQNLGIPLQAATVQPSGPTVPPLLNLPQLDGAPGQAETRIEEQPIRDLTGPQFVPPIGPSANFLQLPQGLTPQQRLLAADLRKRRLDTRDAILKERGTLDLKDEGDRLANIMFSPFGGVAMEGASQFQPELLAAAQRNGGIVTFKDLPPELQEQVLQKQNERKVLISTMQGTGGKIMQEMFDADDQMEQLSRMRGLFEEFKEVSAKVNQSGKIGQAGRALKNFLDEGDPDVVRMSALQSQLTVIARSLSGEKGDINEEAVTRMEKLVPGIMNTDTGAQARLFEFERLIDQSTVAAMDKVRRKQDRARRVLRGKLSGLTRPEPFGEEEIAARARLAGARTPEEIADFRVGFTEGFGGTQ